MRTTPALFRRLGRYYAVYAVGFVCLVIFLAVAEQLGLSPRWIGQIFLFSTIAIYAAIGVMSRTSDVSEYYVAGRRVPALFNGMATAADWMSAASFIGLAGTLYYTGFVGLAFVTGWTGGYVLVALLLAPFLRKFGQFTIPDFLGARYEGHFARVVGVFAGGAGQFCLRGGPDLRRGPHHQPLRRHRVRDRCLRRPGRHPGVFLPGGHAGRHLDPGGPVPHPHHRLPGAGGHPLLQGHRRAGTPGGVWPSAA
jgi:hypothetical protein